MDPEEVHAFLDPLMRRLHGIVESFGGTIVNTMGDGFLAVFGAPVAHPDDAERAVRSAFALRDSVRGERTAPAALDLHAGIQTGWVFIAPGRGTVDVIGDTVNTASRIAGLASSGVVLAGESTRSHTTGSIRYREMDPAVVKGKAEAIRVFEALEVRNSALERFFEPAFTPLVGRSDDRRRLDRAFEEVVRDGCSSLLLIAGQPGVGKSRLARDFATSLAGAAVLVGRGIPFGDRTPWLALAQAIRGLANIEDGDALDTAREKLWTCVESAVPRAPGEERAQLVAQLGLLLGVEESPGVSRAVPGEFNFQMAAAVRRLLTGVAEQRPVVLIFEDLQWADSEVVSFLRWLYEEPWPAPVLVLGLLWEDALDMLGFAPDPRVALTIGTLDRTEMDALLRFLLPGTEVPDSVADEMASRSGGNPLFLQEIVRLLREQGLLVAEPERWILLDLPAIRVPESVHLVVAARIDGLGPDERRLVRDAAVCGPVFTASVLGALGWDSPIDLLGALEERGLVFRRAGPTGAEDEYGFRHAVIRDVAYDSIPRGERAGKHLAVAEHHRARATPGDEPVEILAYHYGQAAVVGLQRSAPDVADLAVVYLTRAGDRALARRAIREAESWLRQAIDVQPPAPARAHTERGRRTLAALLLHADVLFDLGRYDDAREESSRALEMAGIAEDAASQAEAHLQLARLLSLFGDVDSAREVLALADNRFKEVGDDVGRARVVRALADTWRLGDVSQMIGMLEEAAALFSAAGDWRHEHFVYEDLAYVHTTHTPEDFERFYAAGEALVDKAGDRRSRAALLRTKGFHAFYRGRYADAGGPLTEAMTMARDAGDVFVECDSMFLLARIRLAECDFGAARKLAESLVRFGEAQSLRRIHEEGLVVLALITAREGRKSEADALLVQAASLLEEIGADREMVEVINARSVLALESGAWEAAVQGARGYYEKMVRYGDHLEQSRAVLLEARADLGAGRFEAAASQAARARASAERYGQPDVLAMASAVEAQALAALGMDVDAEAVLAGAGDPGRYPERIALRREAEAMIAVARGNRDEAASAFAEAAGAWSLAGDTIWLRRASDRQAELSGL